MALAGLAAVLAVQTQANAQLTAKNGQLDAANDAKPSGSTWPWTRSSCSTARSARICCSRRSSSRRFATKLLRGAADFYGKLEGLLEDQTDHASRAALGKAYDELGELTDEIGNKPEALAVHRKVLTVRRELAEQAGADTETVLDLSRSLIDLGYLESATGDWAAAMESVKEARMRAEGLEASGRGSDAARFVLSQALITQSELESRNPAEAIELTERSRAILQTLVDTNPGVDVFQERLAWCSWDAGHPLVESGRCARRLRSPTGDHGEASRRETRRLEIPGLPGENSQQHRRSSSRIGQIERSAGIAPAGPCDLAKSGRCQRRRYSPPEQRGFRLEQCGYPALGLGQTGRGSRGAPPGEGDPPEASRRRSQ